MAAKHTASMAPGGAASSRVCGIGGSSRSKQTPAAQAPIFVAEKLFDEFSLGRINARHSPSSSGDSSAAGRSESARSEAAGKIGSRDTGFQPSAPPFECIGRSNVELYGFNDIFGGVPGIKSKSGSGDDDVFAMGGAASASSSGANGSSGGNAAPTHQRSSSSGRINSAYESPPTPRYDAETNQSQQHSGGSSSNKTSPLPTDSSSTPPPSSLYSPKVGRESSSGGPHGSSRLRNSGTDAGNAGDRPNQRVEGSFQNKTPPYTVRASPSPHEKSNSAFPAPSCQNSGLLADPGPGKVASLSAPATMPSCLPSVSSCSPRLGSGEKLSNATSEGEGIKPHLSKMPWGTEPTEKKSGKMEADRVKEKPSVGEEVLLPKEENGNKSKSDTGSSPRKSKRPSATERLKAVLFPDFGKKEDKSKSKSWFTVGDLKLVTQPTDVPPPNRAPPEMVEHSQERNGLSKFKRDERWRRNSCEFPLGKGSSLKEAAVHMSPPPPQAEDFVGISSSAMAMKEAVERAEAKLRQKKKSAEVFPETTESDKRGEAKVHEESHVFQGGKEGDIDKRAVERAAHELREKALKKAAERAVAAASVDNGRSNSAPKQRISDEAERNAKKVFYSGEQCRPAVKTESSQSSSGSLANGNLDDERKQKKESSDKTLEERAAKALAEKNQRELTAQQEQEERQRVSATVDAQISAWVAGKEGNLRALLSSLQDVLWLGSGWQPVTSSELSNEASIKKAYRRATLCVHPDKIQQRTIQEKLIAEKVFDLLKGAWTRFNAQEAFFWQVS